MCNQHFTRPQLIFSPSSAFWEGSILCCQNLSKNMHFKKQHNLFKEPSCMICFGVLIFQVHPLLLPSPPKPRRGVKSVSGLCQLSCHTAKRICTLGEMGHEGICQRLMSLVDPLSEGRGSKCRVEGVQTHLSQ